MVGGKKSYKSYELYCSFALNLLVSKLGINIYQDDLGSKLDDILKSQEGVSKAEIKYEIKSNNHMTKKVIEKLESEGLVEVVRLADRYIIKITRAGILHVKKFNEFYWQMFGSEIEDHYRYRGLPSWFKSLK